MPFLGGLGEFSLRDTPDSLLALNLSELARNPRHLKAFHSYLDDVRGPVHWLEFFLGLQNLLHHLHGGDNNDRPAHEAQLDVWATAGVMQSRFLTSRSGRFVEVLDHDTRAAFGDALKSRSTPELTRACELLYKALYKELNYSYVLPFCQSESYMASLCGGASSDARELFSVDGASLRSLTLPDDETSPDALDTSFLVRVQDVLQMISFRTPTERLSWKVRRKCCAGTSSWARWRPGRT